MISKALLVVCWSRSTVEALKKDLLLIAPENRPIAKHFPEGRQVSPIIRRSEAVLTPQLDPKQSLESETIIEEWAVGVHEWLGLVSLQSPRILKGDNVDPFLSRYHVPRLDDASQHEATNQIILAWKGLIPQTWVRSLLVETKYVYLHASLKDRINVMQRTDLHTVLLRSEMTKTPTISSRCQHTPSTILLKRNLMTTLSCAPGASPPPHQKQNVEGRSSCSRLPIDGLPGGVNMAS